MSSDTAQKGEDGLAGLRVLIVEDWHLVGIEIQRVAVAVGCEVIGPVSTLEEALIKAGEREIDGAILDIDLHGKLVFPVAEALLRRSVPIIFSTGVNVQVSIPQEFKGRPTIQKPFGRQELIDLMTQVFVDPPHDNGRPFVRRERRQ